MVRELNVGEVVDLREEKKARQTEVRAKDFITDGIHIFFFFAPGFSVSHATT